MSYSTPTVRVDGNNTSRNATNANVFVLFQAESTRYVQKVVFQPLGNNAATVARIFKNDGGAVANGDSNRLITEVTIAAESGASETAAVPATEKTLGVGLEPDERLLVTIGTAPTAGFDVHAVVGQRYSDFNS